MRSFASDNNSSVHPQVMEALMAANTNHAFGYGDDPWTEEATRKVKEQLHIRVNRCSSLMEQVAIRWHCN